MKVSVVIPVYNVKPYLERCVKSVIGQTYKDLEIILVDDGSTDGSGELCDDIATTDNRIIVIHQNNQGLSGARNEGIRKANGEYIIFIDSDDAWLIDNGLELLIKKIHPNCDLITFKNVDFWDKDRATLTKNYDIDTLNRLPNPQAVFLHLVRTQALRISACFILVRRQILTDNNIFFYKGIISEDLSWSLHLWQHIQTVVIVNLDFYGYYHRENSITTTIANTLHAYQCFDQIFSYWEEQCNQHCINAEAIRIYLADIWVSRGYAFYKLKTSEKSAALAIMKQHSNLLQYATTSKSKRVAIMKQYIGIKNSLLVLGVYWRLRTKIIGHVIRKK